MEPQQGHVEHTDDNGGGFWHAIGNAIKAVAGGVVKAVSHIDWQATADALDNYRAAQPLVPQLNDYAAWKTGLPQYHPPEMLDGWAYEDDYTGPRPDARLLYVNAAGTLSGFAKRNNRNVWTRVYLPSSITTINLGWWVPWN